MTDELDRYLDDFGARLEQRPRARTSVAMRAAVAATAAAAVAVAVVLLTGGSSTRPVDAVAAAQRALAPAGGDIVHLKLATRSANPGVRAPEPTVTEQWTASDPTRWRLVQRLPGGGGRVVGPQEFSYADGARAAYEVEGRRVTLFTGLARSGPASDPPGPFGSDAQRSLPELLDSGRARDLGLVDAGGRQVRRLRVVRRDGISERTLTYDVDPRTSAPVRGELVERIDVAREGPPGARRLISRSTFDVLAYRRIPLTPSSARLLTVRPPAGTELVRYRVREGRGRDPMRTCLVPADRSLRCG